MSRLRARFRLGTLLSGRENRRLNQNTGHNQPGHQSLKRPHDVSSAANPSVSYKPGERKSLRYLKVTKGSGGTLFGLGRNPFHWFPGSASSFLIPDGGQKHGPVVASLAVMTSHKPEQEQCRNSFPQCFGGGNVNLQTTAIRAILYADSAHVQHPPGLVRT